LNRIILGTANFGNSYGVKNTGKILSKAESGSLIRWAQINGINHFDTALAYGDSTEILSSYLDYSLKPSIDTKLNEESCQSRDLIVKIAEENRDKLGTSQLSVVYIHDENLLQTSLGPEITWGFREILDRGIAKKIGVSVYSEESIIACKKVLPELSVFQVPENICDRRLIDSILMQEFADMGNELNVRSIFLQGLLLMDPGLIPPKLRSARLSVQELTRFAEINSITVLDLCLAYAKSIPWATGLLVGAAAIEQINEVISHSAILPEKWSTSISIMPAELIDPRTW